MRWWHTRARRAVEAYVDGELAAARRLAVAVHLVVCPGCREHAFVLWAIKQVLGARRRSHDRDDAL